MNVKIIIRKKEFILLLLSCFLSGLLWPVAVLAEEKPEICPTGIEQKKLSIINSLDRFYDLAVVGKRIWLSGHYGTILYSHDGGETWERQETGISNALLGITAVGQEKLWAVGGEGTIIRSRDGGKTWERLESGKREQLFCVTFVDENRGWVIGGYATLLCTENGGNTWEDVSLDLPLQNDPDGIIITPMFNDIFFIDDLNGWIVGEEGTVLNTTDGGKNWVMKNQGIRNSYLTAVHFRIPQEGIIAGEQGLLFFTRDGGERWEEIPTQTTNELYDIDVKDGQYLVVGNHGKAFTVDTTDEIIVVESLFPKEMKTIDWLTANWLSSIKVSSEGSIVACGWGLILVSSPASSPEWTMWEPFN